MTKRVAIYARVSTGEQTPENQLQELRAVATRMSWQVIDEYIDHGISGTKEGAISVQPMISCMTLSLNVRSTW